MNHPHNAGWLKLFREWVATEAFRDAWEVASQTYGKRFRNFYDSLLKQETAKLKGVWKADGTAPKVIKNLSEVKIEINEAYAISGRVTDDSSERAMIEPLYNRTEITFALEGHEGGRPKYRMRVAEGGSAVLTNEDDEQPSIQLKKAA